MDPSFWLNIILSFFPWGLLKLGIIILVLMYVIFAAVIVRQENLMAKVVEIPFSPILHVVALVHFFVSLIALVLVLVLL